jgi:hypothetical protein
MAKQIQARYPDHGDPLQREAPFDIVGGPPITEVKSHFSGETASTRSGSCSWGQLSLK